MAIEGIGLDSILDEDGISLFNDAEDDISTEDVVQKKEKEPENDDVSGDDKNNTTTEVDPDKLFGESPEGVSSEEDDREGDDTTADTGKGDSPKADFFSSIADALAEEGVFPDLSPDDIKNIKTPEDFLKAVNDQVKAQLDIQQKRVIEALDNNVEPDVIRQYEGVIGWLNNIDDKTLKAEGEEGENLRKRLIYQDFINRGFSKERAEREVNKSLDNGTDIDDAKEALSGNLKYFQDQYDSTLAEARRQTEKDKADREAKAAKLRKSILENDKFFGGDIVLDKNTRQKVYDNISKPVYKDPQTGEFYTAIQKYELDNSEDFLAKLGLVFTLTDGFKNLDGLTKGKIKKEVGKGLRNLENRINNTSRDRYGNLKYASGVSDDESYLGKGVRLAL